MSKKVLFLVFLLVLFFAPTSHAAWDVSVSLYANAEGKSVFKVELTGDGNALSQNIGPLLNAALSAKVTSGRWVYRFKTIPGTGGDAPSGTYTVTLTDRFGDTATLPDRSTSATEKGKISSYTDSGGYLVMYGYLLLTCTDIGNENTTAIYLELI
jgi:hypothetical protein